MSNHNELGLYCTIRPNQTRHISQKLPTVQNKKYVHNIKYVSPYALKFYQVLFIHLLMH